MSKYTLTRTDRYNFQIGRSLYSMFRDIYGNWLIQNQHNVSVAGIECGGDKVTSFGATTKSVHALQKFFDENGMPEEPNQQPQPDTVSVNRDVLRRYMMKSTCTVACCYPEKMRSPFMIEELEEYNKLKQQLREALEGK